MTNKVITKKHLYNLYYEEELPMREIAKIIGKSFATTQRYFVKYDIPRVKRKSLAARQKYADIKRKSGKWKGINNPNWKGGISKAKNERNLNGLRYWAKSVKRRDNDICQNCGLDGKKVCKHCGQKPRMHADHIKSWVDYPKLRLDIDNGRTLCEQCHFLTLGKRGELLETPSGTISSQARA